MQPTRSVNLTVTATKETDPVTTARSKGGASRCHNLTDATSVNGA
jgi:hypothetical protein